MDNKGFKSITELLVGVIGAPRDDLSRTIKKTPLENDYKLTSKVLGIGISGKVRQCTDKTGNKYALKILKDVPKARREVELHWRASPCLHVVNIKDVYENIYEGNKCLLIVMECMEGDELFTKIKNKGSFNEKEAADIIKDMCLAIKYLHDMNIAHRDLKPENLLYSRKGSDMGMIYFLTIFLKL